MAAGQNRPANRRKSHQLRSVRGASGPAITVSGAPSDTYRHCRQYCMHGRIQRKAGPAVYTTPSRRHSTARFTCEDAGVVSVAVASHRSKVLLAQGGRCSFDG